MRFFALVCFIITAGVAVSVTAVAQLTSPEETQKLLKEAIEEGDNGKSSYYAYELGKHYFNLGDSDKATDFFLQGVSYGKKANDNILLYLSYDLLGAVYRDNGKHSKALDSYQRGLKAAEGANKSEFVAEALLNIATSYAATGRHKRAIDPLDKALAVSIQLSDVLLQQKCYELLAEYHKKTGNTVKSNQYQGLYNSLLEQQQHEEESTQRMKELEQEVKQAGKAKQTASSRLAHQTQRLRRAEDSLLATRYSLLETEQSLQEAKLLGERKQLEIDLLNKDKALAEMEIRERDARLKNAALIRNTVIAVALLLTALVSVVIVSYRKKVEANKKIDQQNRSIRSSINYAKRIQEAMLPKPEQQARLLPESFILFKPRDAVSGDFYWFTEIKSWYNPDVVFAAVDCTGHGIPGAFMSMIGINALNGIITRGIAESDQILNTLDKEIRQALQQETTGNNDGMDIALCIHRKEKDILEFAGAKNPLIYIQDGKLFQIKADTHSIGGSQSRREFSYTRHLITIDKPTMVYVFSDGYRDQFGGEKGSKFMSKRFSQLLLDIHQLPMEEQRMILDKTIEAWRGEHPQTDDILVMGVLLKATVVA